MKKRNTVILAALIVFPAAVGLAGNDHETAFEKALGPYEAIHASLAGDSLDDVAVNARLIAEIARKTEKGFSARTAGVPEAKAVQCKELLPTVESGASKLAAAKTIVEARNAFGDLSRAMVQWHAMASGEKPKVAYCPMAKKPWLQEDGDIANPYYGKKMLKCGSFVSQ